MKQFDLEERINYAFDRLRHWEMKQAETGSRTAENMTNYWQGLFDAYCDCRQINKGGDHEITGS